MLPPPLDRLLQRGLHKQLIFPRNLQERSSKSIGSLGQLLAIRNMQIRASVAFVAIPITTWFRPLECRTCTPGLIQRCEQLGLPLKDLGQQMLLLQVRILIFLFLFFAHATTTQPTALRMQSNSERMAGCAVTAQCKKQDAAAVP